MRRMLTVGSADFDGGGWGTVYRALDPRPCFECEREIGKGALFTRKREHVEGELVLTDRCEDCRPFELR